MERKVVARKSDLEANRLGTNGLGISLPSLQFTWVCNTRKVGPTLIIMALPRTLHLQFYFWLKRCHTQRFESPGFSHGWNCLTLLYSVQSTIKLFWFFKNKVAIVIFHRDSCKILAYHLNSLSFQRLWIYF